MAPKTDVIAEPRETIAAQAAEIERLTKINAEICSKSNWYVVENARFEEKLTDSQHKVKVLTDALESWKGIAENCSIEAGYCCCGEDMKTHSHPMSCGHSPVDMADGPVSNAMELTYKALANVKGLDK